PRRQAPASGLQRDAVMGDRAKGGKGHPEPVIRWGKGRGGRPWRRLVEAVKRRDQYTCQSCGRVTEDGECDHIVPLSQGGKTELANLQWNDVVALAIHIVPLQVCQLRLAAL